MVDIQTPGENFQYFYEKYTNLAFLRRGLILNETILLERIIDDYIVEYFCHDQNKQKELKELIICTNRMIFENKVQVFKVLVEKYNREFVSAYPKFMADLKTIIEERNIFAHYWLVTSAELVQAIKERKTIFVKYKNTVEHLTYAQEDIERIMGLINLYINATLTLQK